MVLTRFTGTTAKASHEKIIMDHSETGNESAIKQPGNNALNRAKDVSSGVNNIDENSGIEFFPVSEGKLMTLYILSFGLYGVYWFYKNWKLQEKFIDKKIYPLWRAIFSIFFTHSLFKRIDLKASDLPKQHKFNANGLATFFVFAIVMSNLLDRLFANTGAIISLPSNAVIIASLVLFFLSTYPLVRVQATVNRINNDMLGFLNNSYSLANYALIVFGGIFWLLVALGLLLDSMGMAIAE